MIPDFGMKKVFFDEIEGTKELLLAGFYHNKQEYTGIVDINGKVLVPFSNIEIQECFSDFSRNNYCFTRFDDGKNNYESFHLSKTDENFHMVADITGNEITSCRLVNTIKDNYWFIESTTDGITEVCLYDVKNHKILTPLFTEISFEKEKGKILAYVEKELYTKKENDIIILGSLVSFIDHQGNFITPLYMPEKNQEYDARSYKFDTSFKSFNRTVQSIIQILELEYDNNTVMVTNHINYMFSNPYTEEEMNSAKRETKILNYTRRNK